MVIRMRYVGRASAPDDGPDPRKSNHEHTQYRAEHEDLNSAKALRKFRETHAKHAIGQAEKKPRDEARSQQMTRHAPKSENGNQGNETQNSHRGQVADKSKAFEQWNTVGDDHPSAKYNGENDPDVDTRANRWVPENMERPIRGQLSANGHQTARSQDRG